MADTLPCADGGGSINNPANPVNNPGLKPFVPNAPCVGEWEISGLQDSLCQNTDQQRQESYVAESLNISGAPINIFKLLGVHEQGNGSVLSLGKVIASQAYPGFPVTGINTSSWKSLQVASAVANAAYVGMDFGAHVIPPNTPDYQPLKPNWIDIASIAITQANTPNEYARQVKVEIADGKCEAFAPVFTGTGNGFISTTTPGINALPSNVTITAVLPTSFTVTAIVNGALENLGIATVGVPFYSPLIKFTINAGTIPFAVGDVFTITMEYIWKRQGIFNLIQSPLPQTLNLQAKIKVKAFRVIPILFSGTGSWEVTALDAFDSAPTDINNIQDLFFNENRDRDYSKDALLIKAQYSPTDSMSDLSKFGLNILDQYSFTVSFQTMVGLLGRPIVIGDIIEVIPEMQWDQNLMPIRKFLEVTDSGWASEGFSTQWKPTVFRFSAQQALPSQETRDIFGTLDTQKYLIADKIFTDGIGEQLDTTPLTIMEEIAKDAAAKVPEVGSDDLMHITGTPLPKADVPINQKGQVPVAPYNGKQGIYIEDGLPNDGSSYGEGYALPDSATATDGEYFRLYYPPETKIAPRLYRFSMIKNRWIFMETDRRADYSSHKPSIRNILQSNTKQGLGKKI